MFQFAITTLQEKKSALLKISKTASHVEMHTQLLLEINILDLAIELLRNVPK